MKIYESYDDLPKLKLPYGNDVYISDSTIRDGSQMPGIVLSREHKLQIYEYLHEIGIEKLEAFVFNKRDRDAVDRMFDIGYEFPEITGWARASRADIDKVLEVDGINETGILMSVSDTHIFSKMKLSGRVEAEEKQDFFHLAISCTFSNTQESYTCPISPMPETCNGAC